MAHPGGRPKTFDPDDLAKKLNDYINSAFPFPILAEFAVVNDISREYLYQLGEKHPKLSYAIKKCSAAKEFKLEQGMANGNINPGYGNFALKQLGWRDKQEIEHSGDIITKVIIERVDNKKE